MTCRKYKWIGCAAHMVPALCFPYFHGARHWMVTPGYSGYDITWGGPATQ